MTTSYNDQFYWLWHHTLTSLTGYDVTQWPVWLFMTSHTDQYDWLWHHTLTSLTVYIIMTSHNDQFDWLWHHTLTSLTVYDITHWPVWLVMTSHNDQFDWLWHHTLTSLDVSSIIASLLWLTDCTTSTPLSNSCNLTWHNITSFYIILYYITSKWVQHRSCGTRSAGLLFSHLIVIFSTDEWTVSSLNSTFFNPENL